MGRLASYLYNFLRFIPGHNGIPLSYIVCSNNASNLISSRANVLDDYIYHSPLNGESFDIDTNEVHTYLVKYLEGNATAE